MVCLFVATNYGNTLLPFQHELLWIFNEVLRYNISKCSKYIEVCSYLGLLIMFY